MVTLATWSEFSMGVGGGSGWEQPGESCRWFKNPFSLDSSLAKLTLSWVIPEHNELKYGIETRNFKDIRGCACLFPFLFPLNSWKMRERKTPDRERERETECEREKGKAIAWGVPGSFTQSPSRSQFHSIDLSLYIYTCTNYPAHTYENIHMYLCVLVVRQHQVCIFFFNP